MATKWDTVVKNFRAHELDIIEWRQHEIEKRWTYESAGVLANSTADARLGVLKRQSEIARVHYHLNYNTMDMIVVTLRIFDNVTQQELNFGTLFCELYKHIAPVRINHLAHHNQTQRDVVFTYFSASISYESADGEYRSRFSECRIITRAQTTFPELWDDITAYINHQIPRRRWSMYQRYFYPKQHERNSEREVEMSVKNSGIATSIFALTWFHMMYEKAFGVLDTNINKKYRLIFGPYEIEDNARFALLMEKYGSKLADFCTLTNRAMAIDIQNPGMRCGYKMIPMNIRETQYPLKLIYSPWREYFVLARTNDFVINAISPSFPIIMDWFYIKNSRPGLFDSESQEQRMRKSTIARGILQSLREAQRSTFFATEHIEGIPPTDQNKFVDSRFRRLHRKVEDPIQYCEEEIVMSEVALSFVLEYVGRTFANTIRIVTESSRYDKLIGRPFAAAGYDNFAKYMFEICYALLCCNTKLGAIHGDLHLNNATIGQLYVMSEEEKKNSYVVYTLSDEDDFVFHNAGYFANLIDFSRAIINPLHWENFIDSNLPRAKWHIVDNDNDFRTFMVEKMLHKYVYIIPGKLKYKDELSVIFKKHTAAAFKLLTAIDIWMFTNLMKRTFASIGLKVSKPCLALVMKMNRLAENYLNTKMLQLIDGGDQVARTIEEDDWPMMKILKQCFGEYKSSARSNRNNSGDRENAKAMVITDAYSYNNEMSSSLSAYESFPRAMKGTTYRDENGVFVDMFYEARKKHRDVVEQLRESNLAMVEFIAKRHREKLF